MNKIILFITKNILGRICILLLISGFWLVKCQLSQYDQQIDFIYSPFYLQKIDILQNQASSTKIKVAKKANLVFAAAGLEGIIVIDGKSNQVIFQQNSNEFLFALQPTSDGEFLMFPYNKQFSLFNFKNQTQLILLSQAAFPTSILDMQINSSETIVFVVGLNGQVVAYDISNKSQIYQIGQFNTQSNLIYQLVISFDEKWILLGDDLLGLSVLSIQTNPKNNGINFQLAAQSQMYWKTYAIAITSDNKYAYGTDTWSGIYICDFSQISNATPDKFPLSIIFQRYWPFDYIYPSYDLILSKDNNYLFVGMRSLGICIFNIKERLQPVFFQLISIEGLAFSIALSYDERLLYYANAKSIYIFQQTIPNLNNEYPNLFNTHQAKSQNNNPAVFKWRCLTKTIEGIDYFFGSFDIHGAYIADATDPYNLKQIYLFVNPPDSVDSMQLSADLRYLYVPSQSNNTSFYVFDIADITQPKISFAMENEQIQYNEQFFFSKDYQYIVCSYEVGVILIDSSKPPSLVLLDFWRALPEMAGDNLGAMITNDNKYIIGTVENYGFYILDATNKTNLVLKNQSQTLGGEGIVPSLYNDGIAFLFDGLNGIVILDLTVLPEIKYLSNISVQGWANFIYPIQNDQYLLVAEADSGMISLIDIKNIAAPKLISTYQYQKPSAYGVCTSPNQEYSFILNAQGTIVLPLKSQVLIHTEFQLVNNIGSGQQTYTSLQKDQKLLVGQSIQFNFVFIYPIAGIKIESVQYYFNFQIQNLPFWINYDYNNQILMLQIDKNGLDTRRLTEANQNIILLKILLPLKSNQFQYNYTDFQTTPDQAQTIYSYLQQSNLLDSSGYITNSFDPGKNLQFQLTGINSSQRLFDAVLLTLQRSYYINPVQFYVESSLKLDIHNLTTPIQTLSQQVQLYMQVKQNMGKFVVSSFQGVIFSTNSDQTQLILQGSLKNINSLLSQNIIFANQTSWNSISVTLTLIDGVNYDVSQTALLQDCVFIKQKQKLQKNQNLSLQSQFNRQYPDAVINIDEQFSITFSQKSFQVGDVQQILYQAFILQNNQYTELTQNDWILFQNSSGAISFQGQPPTSYFQKQFNIKIIASDGYTEDYDTFNISVSGIPFQYILNLLLKILGPIFGILGLYRYKSYFLNLIFKEKVLFSKDTAIVGKLYQKKIAVLGDEMQKSKLLFKGFLQKNGINYKNQVKQKQTRKSLSHQQQQDILKLKLNEKITLQQSDNTQNYLEQRKQTIQSQQDQNKQTLVKNQKIKQKLKKSVLVIDKEKKQKYQSQIEKDYLLEDGNINILKIIKSIKKLNVSFSLKGKQYTYQNFKTDFKDSQSKIFKSILALAARYFLKLDTKSQEVYNYLKFYAQNSTEYTENDWYKSYVNLFVTDQRDSFGFPIPFPECQLNGQQINQILQDLNLNYSNDLIQQQNGHFINFKLIREVLFADALGLVEYSPSTFSPCIGESIHLFPYQIQSLEVFQKVKNQNCITLKKFFNLDYVNYGMTKNMALPNWLKFNLKNGVIILQGTPQSQDIDSILIRIIDINQYVIKQFHFDIIDDASMNIETEGDQNIINETNQMNDNSPTNQISFIQTSIAQPVIISKQNQFMDKKAKLIVKQSLYKENFSQQQCYTQQSNLQNSTGRCYYFSDFVTEKINDFTINE